MEFKLTEFLYRRNQMSAADINILLNLWVASLVPYGAEPPFSNHNDLYKTIDSSPLGGMPWESFMLNYGRERPEGSCPSWMDADYEIWFRDPKKIIHNLIAKPNFKDEFDYVPYHEYKDGVHHFQDFMLGDWAWKQAVRHIFPIYPFLIKTDVDHNCRRSCNAWHYVRTHHSWER